MNRKHIGTLVVGVIVALGLMSGCSASKKTSTTAVAAAATNTSATSTAGAAGTPSANVGAVYLAAIAPVDKLRDEYEASKGTPARATIAPLFAASLRTFDAAAWTSGCWPIVVRSVSA